MKIPEWCTAPRTASRRRSTSTRSRRQPRTSCHWWRSYGTIWPRAGSCCCCCCCCWAACGDWCRRGDARPRSSSSACWCGPGRWRSRSQSGHRRPIAHKQETLDLLVHGQLDVVHQRPVVVHVLHRDVQLARGIAQCCWRACGRRGAIGAGGGVVQQQRIDDSHVQLVVATRLVVEFARTGEQRESTHREHALRVARYYLSLIVEAKQIFKTGINWFFLISKLFVVVHLFTRA